MPYGIFKKYTEIRMITLWGVNLHESHDIWPQLGMLLVSVQGMSLAWHPIPATTVVS